MTNAEALVLAAVEREAGLPVRVTDADVALINPQGGVELRLARTADLCADAWALLRRWSERVLLARTAEAEA